jgi:hypothetical protein
VNKKTRNVASGEKYEMKGLSSHNINQVAALDAMASTFNAS